MTNTTSTEGEQSGFGDNWAEFLANNTGFILPLDFIRDMAVDDPGISSVLYARFGEYEMQPNTTSFLPFFGTKVSG